MSCPHRVKPFPYEFCEGCMLNGCYPWNRNPLLLCGLLGGLSPAIQVRQGSEEIPRECVAYKLVTDETWMSHLNDLKTDAKSNEEIRKRAMRGEAYSSEPLPTESISQNP